MTTPQLLRWLILALWIVEIPCAAAPRLSLEAEIGSHVQRAEQQAAKGQTAAAIRTLSQAREALSARQQKAMAAPRRAPSAAHQRETAELQKWLKAKTQGLRPGGTPPPAVMQEYRQRQLALRQRELKRNPPRPAAEAATMPRFQLVEAGINDTAAGILQRQGEGDQANLLRLTAEQLRLRAYSATGRSSQADQAAERLARLGSRDAVALDAAAEYHQQRKRYEKAAALWTASIRAGEKGRPSAASVRRYREQAFCFEKLGKPRERDTARAAADRVEAALSAPRSRR